MDERIINILNILETDDSLSQREISRRANISLGTVNALISRCIRTGLVKVKKLNSRNIRYMLTPEGMKELTRKSMAYIKRSYQAILEVEQKVRELAEEMAGEGKDIILLGAEDEIYQIAARTLQAANIGFQHVRIKEELPREGNCFVIHWDPDFCEPEGQGIEIRNIFSRG